MSILRCPLLPALLLVTGLVASAPALARQAPCSGRTVGGYLAPQAGLPAPVARARAAIARAASRCEFDALARLASAGEAPFTFTFGPPEGGPAAFWRQAEAGGEPVLRTLVLILKMPHARESVGTGPAHYVWPSAAGARPGERDWQALRPLYKTERAWLAAVETYRVTVGAYIGYRVGITAAGDWAYFVAGD